MEDTVTEQSNTTSLPDNLDWKSVIHPDWYKINPEIEEAIEEYLTEHVMVRKTHPFGYKESPPFQRAEPCPEVLVDLIKLLVECKWTKKRVFREALEIVQSKLNTHPENYGQLTSIGSLSALFSRLEIKFGLSDKVLSPDRVKRIQKDRIAREGKVVKNPSSDVKAKRRISRDITEKNIQLKQLKQKESNLKQAIRQKAKQLELKGNPTKYNWEEDNPYSIMYKDTKARQQTARKKSVSVRTKTLVEVYTEGLSQGRDEKELLEIYKEIMDSGKVFQTRTVGFLPTPRQYQFLSAPEDIVLYGGSAG